MYTKPSRPYWVCLKRKGETIDATAHVIFGETRMYSAPTYRGAKQAMCGKERGANGWRLVQRRDSKQMPKGYCETCWLLSLVEQMK